MSDELGKYTFLPWLRQGISTQLGQTDGTPVPATGQRPGRRCRSVVARSPATRSASPSTCSDRATLRPSISARSPASGPGRTCSRWSPTSFRCSSSIPADVAWRYTPASANAQDRLRPWLGLIVLRDDEIDTIDGPTRDRPLTALTTQGQHAAAASRSALGVGARPRRRQPTRRRAELQDLIDNASHQVVARLLCPRRLDQTHRLYGVPRPHPRGARQPRSA